MSYVQPTEIPTTTHVKCRTISFSVVVSGFLLAEGSPPAPGLCWVDTAVSTKVVPGEEMEPE